MTAGIVRTTVGLVSIENIKPGDMVYAKEAVGIEQSVDVYITMNQ